MCQTLLLSDLHLSKNTPDFNKILITKLSEWAIEYDAIYFLGDVFDIWLGDDMVESYALEIIQSLLNLSIHKPLYFMCGNRDFLIGHQFLKRSGAILLHDPCLIKIYKQYYILSHGDILCTDDIQYQKFRQRTRDPTWKNKTLNKPQYYRKLLAKTLRMISYYKGKICSRQNIGDATKLGIQQLKNNFIQCPDANIIHGHTHKPKIHSEQFIINQDVYPFTRYVLPDWRPKVHAAISIDDKNQIRYIYF